MGFIQCWVEPPVRKFKRYSLHAPGTQTAGGGIKATVLTEEHRTYNPIERERLIREHPCEDEDIMFFDERLCGILQVIN